MKKKMCTATNCWICEKSGTKTSIEIHDHIMEQIKLKARYFLAFNQLGNFLIGEDENDRIYNRCGSPDFNGNPIDWALEILGKSGADRRFGK